MEIRILGPVELRAGGRRNGLRSDKERCALAALALDVGRPVSLDHLAERLWDEPPLTARQSLHTYISRLRRALAETGAGGDVPQITQRTHTYQLDTDPDRIDWHRFRALVRRAENADDATAATLLNQAEALWEGEALAGLSGLWAGQVRAGLGEARRAAIQARIAIGLRQGRFTQLTGELALLTTEYPDDERLIGHLMVAYYGRGRYADALRVYRDARRLLNEELGTDPGNELKQIHHLVLNREPLEVFPGMAARTAAGTSGRRPHNLPPDTPLVGRQRELDRLHAAVGARPDGGSAVALETVSGMAGVGKTALAVHAAHRLTERFPDAQLYLDLRAHAQEDEPLTADAALSTLLSFFEVEARKIPSGTEERSALWRSMLAGLRTVIVLDDADSPEQIRPLLPSSSSSLAIVTSRRHLAGLPHAGVVVLDVLPPEDAIALFRRLAGDPGRTADTRQVATIVALCGHLPLAVELLANRLRAHPAWTLATLRELLGRSTDHLGEFWDGHRDLAGVFELSYRTLEPDQQTMFRRLGLHPGAEFGVPAAAALTGFPPARAERLLESLLHCHLLQEPHPHRYRMHDLLAAYSRALARSVDSEEERGRALGRLVDHCLDAADRADRMLYPNRVRLDVPRTGTQPHLPEWAQGDDAKRWFGAERSNLLAMERYARTNGAPEQAALLSHCLARLLDADSHWTAAERIQRHAVDYWRRVGRRRALCLALLDLCATQTRTGQYQTAAQNGQDALAFARAVRDSEAEATAFAALGVLNYHLGQNAAALDFHQEALRIRTAAGDFAGCASSQNNIAISLLSLGQLDEALENFEQALQGLRRAGDKENASRTLNNIGELCAHRGETEAARQAFEQALSLARSTRNRSDQAIIQMNLAGVLTSLGDLPSALDLYHQTLFRLRALGDQKNLSNTLNGMGTAYRIMGRPRDAATQHEKALAISRAIGAAHEEGYSLRCLGMAEHEMGDEERASAHLESAIAVAVTIQEPEEEADGYAALAEVWYGQGRHGEAGDLWCRALRILRERDGKAAERIRGRLRETLGEASG